MMRRELVVPKLGLTMTEGTLLEWLVKPGERFRADQSIFVIESEKAAVEVPAEADGVLLEATAAVGTTLTLGSVIGYWDDGGQAQAAPATVPETPGGSQAQPAPAAMAATLPATAPATPDAAAAAAPRLLATPLARRLARERGIDLREVAGSGPRGRIRAGDLPATARVAAPVVPAPALPAALAAAPAAGAGTLRPATPTEQTIARRLVAAKQEIPHFYLSVEAEVSAVQKLRGELTAAQSEQRFTLNHFILAAVARALAQMPQVNRVWTADGILALQDADVGMAVHTERGLLVPVLRDLGRQPLSAVARHAAAAATKAQAGRLGAADMAGGAITVSNAGMHDVTYMTSIINPGQSMILGVGSVRGVFRPGTDDQPVLRRELGMVLSADHRVLDGVTALQFLKRVVTALENPLSLLVA
jgi:pyruvate dehydrogenase E2 component (dihydrolipoamide acetyltransferase)